jgi:hypothetical protein
MRPAPVQRKASNEITVVSETDHISFLPHSACVAVVPDQAPSPSAAKQPFEGRANSTVSTISISTRFPLYFGIRLDSVCKAVFGHQDLLRACDGPQRVKKRMTERRPSHVIVCGPTQRVDTIRLSTSGPRESGVVFRQYSDSDCGRIALMSLVSLRYYTRNRWNQICQGT